MRPRVLSRAGYKIRLGRMGLSMEIDLFSYSEMVSVIGSTHKFSDNRQIGNRNEHKNIPRIYPPQ